MQANSAGGATGTILYNGSSVRDNRGGFAASLGAGLYAEGALPPATTWLDATPPADPTISVTTSGDQLSVTISGNSTDVRWWFVRWRSNGTWKSKMLPSATRATTVPGTGTDAVAVAAVDPVGNASGHGTWQR